MRVLALCPADERRKGGGFCGQVVSRESVQTAARDWLFSPAVVQWHHGPINKRTATVKPSVGRAHATAELSRGQCSDPVTMLGSGGDPAAQFPFR